VGKYAERGGEESMSDGEEDPLVKKSMGEGIDRVKQEEHEGDPFYMLMSIREPATSDRESTESIINRRRYNGCYTKCGRG
jgi:hypothetical protein